MPQIQLYFEFEPETVNICEINQLESKLHRMPQNNNNNNNRKQEKRSKETKLWIKCSTATGHAVFKQGNTSVQQLFEK